MRLLRGSRRVAALLVPGVVMLGCGSAPISQALFGPSLARQGAELAAEIEEQGLLQGDDALSAYLRAIGERLASEAEKSPVDAFHFAVLDAPEPNAFALPGGYVYVSRGLLVLLNTEDELAGILGHEIGHILARHHAKRLARDVPLMPFRIVTRITGSVVGLVLPGVGGVLSATGDVTSALAHAPYSRGQENEADEIGQELAARAGWDPTGISSVMDALAAEARLQGHDPNRQSFLSSHPTSPKRSARTREHALKLERAEPSPIAGTRAAFFGRLDGLVVGTKASEGVFHGPEFLHPELDFAIAFPASAGWQRLNLPSMVGAVNEHPPTAVLLELVAEGDDALDVALAFEPKNGSLDAPPVADSVNGRPAARARGGAGWGRGAVRAELWWIAHAGRVYRLTCATGRRDFDGLTDRCDATARSFRALVPTDLANIVEDRLRALRAREGDSLADLLVRISTRWTLQQAAVANAIEPVAKLASGELVKVAVTEPYEF